MTAEEKDKEGRATSGKGKETTFSYVQGMNVLLAPFLYVMPSELEAFHCFCHFIELNCPTYVQPSLSGVHKGLEVSGWKAPGLVGVHMLNKPPRPRSSSIGVCRWPTLRCSTISSRRVSLGSCTALRVSGESSKEEGKPPAHHSSPLLPLSHYERSCAHAVRGYTTPAAAASALGLPAILWSASLHPLHRCATASHSRRTHRQSTPNEAPPTISRSERQEHHWSGHNIGPRPRRRPL